MSRGTIMPGDPHALGSPASDSFMREESTCLHRHATATADNAAGNDQAQSPRYITAADATTQPTKKPVRRWRAPLSLLVPPSIRGCFCDFESISASTAFVKLPVMTAVEG